MNKKIKIVLIFFIISLIIILIVIPNLPYKFPGKLKNPEYTELDIAITESTGGPEVLSGNNNITEYGEKMGYKNLNVHEVYLSSENSLYDTVISGISNSNNDYIRYRKFRVYGEFEKGPDKYGVLTFNVIEWFPLEKYIAIKDTIEWEKYQGPYRILVKCNIVLLIIFIVLSIVSKKLNRESA